MIECQVNYIVQCIGEMISKKYKTIEVKKSAEEDYTKGVYAQMKKTVWGSGSCRSWYTNDNGEVTALWPYNCTTYWWRTWRPNFSHFTFGR